MYYLVVLVLDDKNLCKNVLEAWKEADTPGITILDSTGIGAGRKSLIDDMPLFPNLVDTFMAQEKEHRTLFSVVKGEERVDRLVKAVRSCICGFEEQEDMGFLFVVPVSQVYGSVFHQE